jgi:hypothetical protein
MIKLLHQGPSTQEQAIRTPPSIIGSRHVVANKSTRLSCARGGPAREGRGEIAARVLGFWFQIEITQYENGPSGPGGGRFAPSLAICTPPCSLLFTILHMVRATGACMQYLDDIIELIT